MQARDAIGSAYTKWKTFDGRASRSEYWWFVLFVFLGSLLAGLVDQILFGSQGGADRTEPIGALFSLVILLPALAVLVRRLHDIGKSGWFAALPAALGLLYAVSGVMAGLGAGIMQNHGMGGGIGSGMAIPATFLVLGATGALIASILSLIVLILMLIWLTRPGDDGPNQYGPKPD
ncbi:DUF805 domain-containing protein [Thioclava sp. FR2]|uniref:DUF805 domain-containing protein n=1 Tax=Thioclava sp. FR2 TaxID=3445780 RepID=UPI003EB7D443